MKILLLGRNDLYKRVGGDTTIIENLQIYLKRKGIKVYTSFQKSQNYDLIHYFGIMRVPDLYNVYKTHGQSIPYIINPIYESHLDLDIHGRLGFERIIAKLLAGKNQKELFKASYRSLNDINHFPTFLSLLFTSFHTQQFTLLKNATYIICSSRTESTLLRNEFSIPINKIKIIPYGINNLINGDKAEFKKKFHLENFILCVGRIEPKKNQLGVITALQNTDIPLVFVGKKNVFHQAYVKKFLIEVKKNPNIYYLGELEDSLLRSAYAAAKVHVLASWFEAPGLVSLEAAVNGCNIVTTKNGYAKDYFGNYAWYCQPDKPESIKKAILLAYSSKRNTKLRSYIVKNFTWEKNISKFINVYQSLID